MFLPPTIRMPFIFGGPFLWRGMYRIDMLPDIIHSYCIKKQILKTKINFFFKTKLILIQNPIFIIQSISTLDGSFVRCQNSEFPLSLQILCNSLQLRYSEHSQILLSLSSNPEVDRLRHSVKIRNSSSLVDFKIA
jgi:hypothetical protein